MLGAGDMHIQLADVTVRSRPVAPIERSRPQPARQQLSGRSFTGARTVPPLRSAPHFPRAALNSGALQSAAQPDESPGEEIVSVAVEEGEQPGASTEADARSQVKRISVFEQTLLLRLVCTVYVTHTTTVV